jgi:hypothetical protein
MILRVATTALTLMAMSHSPATAQTRIAAVSPQNLAPAAVPAPARPQVPSAEAMIILIRASLVALSQANLTNNYSVLNTLGSDTFRQANPPSRLAEIFAPFRTNKIDLNPVVYVTPQLTQQPAMANGRLRLVGYFPTLPMRVNYDLTFEPSAGNWKLFGLGVNLVQAPPAAPAAAVAPSR